MSTKSLFFGTTSFIITLIISRYLVVNVHSFVTTTPPFSVTRTNSKLFLFIENELNNSLLGRRDILAGNAAFLMASVLLKNDNDANAFENKISTAYDDRPKRKGPQPSDLGLRKRKDMEGEEYTGLKPCDAAPHCFCSTDNSNDDPMHSISPWKWPSSLSGKEAAFEELLSVLKSYPPGQGNIDGGGFKIVTSDTKNGYLYLQFEALKNGYIDDFEAASIDDDGAVQIRSSSRVGYLDFGVNAKRINWISEALRKKGWDAPGVDLQAQHYEYASENRLI